MQRLSKPTFSSTDWSRICRHFPVQIQRLKCLTNMQVEFIKKDKYVSEKLTRAAVHTYRQSVLDKQKKKFTHSPFSFLFSIFVF